LSIRVPIRAGAALAAAVAVLSLPTAADAKLGDRTLRLHSRGGDVRALQAGLTRLGHRTAVDGWYGRATRRAVRRYERARDQRVDGVVSRRQGRGLRTRVAALAEPPASPPATEAAPAEAPGDVAVVAPDGRTAVAPAAAPQEVKDAIAAANRIAGRPYRYGGGHGRWEDRGYDCSGAVSYALHGAGLLARPLASGNLASWGRAGRGEWITVYANGGHAFAVIAGLRFDTSGRGGSGPRWRPEPRSGRGYAARHPRGL